MRNSEKCRGRSITPPEYSLPWSSGTLYLVPNKRITASGNEIGREYACIAGFTGQQLARFHPLPTKKNKTKQANKQIKKHSAKRAKWMNEIKYKNDITKQAWCLILQNNYWLGDFLNKELLFNFQQISRPLKISQEMILKMHSKNYLWSEHAPQPRSQVLSPTCHPVLPRVLSYPSPDCTFPSF